MNAICSWRAHPPGCPVYGMAYRNARTIPKEGGEEVKDLPSRLFTSSCDGEVKEWDPIDGSFQQMTIITVRGKIIYVIYCLA